MMTHTDSQFDDAQDQWEPCQGEISRMVRRLDGAERRQRLRQLASTATFGLVLFAAGAIVLGGFVFFREPHFGGIGCTECLSHAAEYRDHLAGVKAMADLKLAQQMKSHLELCGCCGAKFKLAYPDVSLAGLGMEPLPLSNYRLAFSLAGNSRGY